MSQSFKQYIEDLFKRFNSDGPNKISEYQLSTSLNAYTFIVSRSLNGKA